MSCLMVNLRKSSTHKTGLQLELTFQITQHTRDKQLLLELKNYFNCGRYRQRISGLAGDFNVSKLSDLSKIIIPFFEKHLIIGVKAKDFEAFKQIAKLMNSSAHLTLKGL